MGRFSRLGWTSLFGLQLLAAALGSSAFAGQSGWDFSEAARIPVQSGGRTKPLDSLAREMVLHVTGSRSFQGWDPVELMFSWLASPESWNDQAFIQVSREDVRRQVLLDESRGRFSPRELFQNHALLQYAERGGRQQVSAPKEIVGQASTTDPRDQELKRVLDRIWAFKGIVSGEAWPVVPVSAPGHPWLMLAKPDSEAKPVKSVELIRNQYMQMALAYRSGDRAAFERLAPQLRAAVEGEIASWSEGQRRVVHSEVLYNRLRPFQVAWVLYLLAGLLWLVVLALWQGSEGASRWISRVAYVLNAAGFLAHTGGIGLRCYIAGRPPVSNMYESVLWVSMGVVLFAVILFVMHRQKLLLAVSSLVATVLLILADAAPAMLDPGIHPLVPVLRSNFWLTTHVLTITLGYAAFALTLGIANVTLFQFVRGTPSPQRVTNLNQLTYRAMQFGVVLLAAGTILGGVWADYSWGRFWGWDPKEVWALIALLCYVAILHGRFAGWVGQFGFAVWSVLAFLSVIMAWYGVNFVLGAGLHSYGFSSGGAPAVTAFVALEFAYVGLAIARRTFAGNGQTASPAPR